MVPKDTASSASCLTPEMVPEVHAISKDPLHYSIVSAPAAQKVRELESTIAVDPGEKQSIQGWGDSGWSGVQNPISQAKIQAW